MSGEILTKVDLEDLRKRSEDLFKRYPLLGTDNSTVPAGVETYVKTFEVPLKEIWIIDKIIVTNVTGDTIKLSRVIIQPNNRDYGLTDVALNNFKPNNAGTLGNVIVLDPPIVLDKEKRIDIAEFRFSASSAQTLGLVFVGAKIIKG